MLSAIKDKKKKKKTNKSALYPKERLPNHHDPHEMECKEINSRKTTGHQSSFSAIHRCWGWRAGLREQPMV